MYNKVKNKVKWKILQYELKIMLNKIRLYSKPRFKKIDIKTGKNLNWHNHINDLAAKPNTRNALLFKSRNYVNQKILTSIWFAIFDSNLMQLILFCLSVPMQFNELSYYKKSHQNNIIPVSKLSSVPFFRKKKLYPKNSWEGYDR